MFDLIIIGGGPAGVAAGVYAARKQLKTALVTESFGGQSVDSLGIENWIGTPSVSGEKLAELFENHVRVFEGEALEVMTGTRAENIEKTDGGFSVTLSNGDTLETKTVLIATGASRKKLKVPGAEKYENKGITYCASCDGPLFVGADTVVIGGGNAGFEAAAQLLAYAKSVTLLHKNAEFKADPITVEKVTDDPKMKAIPNAVIKEVKGDAMATSVVYEDSETGEEAEIAAEGVFVEIGNIPATGFVKDVVDLDEYGRIITDPKTQRTSTDGIWAAGDATDTLYHQNNIAAGDGVRALEDLYLWIKKQ